MTLYHLPNQSDVYNYIRQTNFNNTEIDNFPYQFNGKTTEYASVSKNYIKEDIGMVWDFSGDLLSPDSVEEIRYPIAKYEISGHSDNSVPLSTMMSNTIKLLNDSLLDSDYDDINAPSINGVNTYFGAFSGSFDYNFKGLGLVLDTVNTIGSRRNKLNTTLQYNSEDYTATTSLFSATTTPRIMLPLQQNVFSTSINQTAVDNISANENSLLKLENDFYPLQKWVIVNNQLTIFNEDGTQIQNTSVEKNGNTLVVKSLQLPQLLSTDMEEQKTKQFRDSS